MDKCKCYINGFFEVGRDYKVQDLVEYVGISRQGYNDIVNGKAMPRVNVAIKICDFFTEFVEPEGSEYIWTVDDFWRF